MMRAIASRMILRIGLLAALDAGELARRDVVLDLNHQPLRQLLERHVAVLAPGLDLGRRSLRLAGLLQLPRHPGIVSGAAVEAHGARRNLACHAKLHRIHISVMTDVTPLRAFRKAQAQKMPLRELALKVGVSESQLSRIEREGTDSLPLAIKLAEITSLPVEAFAKPASAVQRGGLMPQTPLHLRQSPQARSDAADGLGLDDWQGGRSAARTSFLPELPPRPWGPARPAFGATRVNLAASKPTSTSLTNCSATTDKLPQYNFALGEHLAHTSNEGTRGSAAGRRLRLLALLCLRAAASAAGSPRQLPAASRRLRTPPPRRGSSVAPCSAMTFATAALWSRALRHHPIQPLRLLAPPTR
jgi:transcriptional regulator with XRE-family HTH domain